VQYRSLISTAIAPHVRINARHPINCLKGEDDVLVAAMFAQQPSCDWNMIIHNRSSTFNLVWLGIMSFTSTMLCVTCTPELEKDESVRRRAEGAHERLAAAAKLVMLRHQRAAVQYRSN
jgi:hypothetical protein